ncbi:MAG: hypothetical protein SZ59_C0002G0225 [candidate division TM6 bacterium GW2011_GWF2_28_16]|nr:MAG: hypothetical protein SZ59_C0002G0225 [candidate division TM6 bacterium GW2011_GWF2_28_16]
MKYLIKILMALAILLQTNIAFSTISISGNNIEDLKASIQEFEALMPQQEDNQINEKLGFADVYLKKVGDKYDQVAEIISANQRLLKLSGITGTYVYAKYINPTFFPNLVTKASAASVKYMSIFTNALLTGFFKGAWANKSWSTTIVVGLVAYGVVNNVIGIGLRAITERFVSESRYKAENRMKNIYGSKQEDTSKKVQNTSKS